MIDLNYNRNGKALPVLVQEFPGSNNVEHQAVTRLVHNMDVTEDQKLKLRRGYTLFKTMSNSHSLWSDGNQLFCVADGSAANKDALHIISPNAVSTRITDIDGRGDPLFYVMIGTRVYMSSKNWNGVYELGSVRAWGVDYSDDIADYSAAVTSEEWMKIGETKAPFMENLAHAGSRIWGTVGSKLYFNDPPLAYEMFRLDTFIDFGVDLNMVAVTPNGLYIGSETSTWYTGSLDPNEFRIERRGSGVIAGTLAYSPNHDGSGHVPIWLSDNGVEKGVDGQVTRLNDKAIKVGHTPGVRAAAFFNGKDKRFTTSMPAPIDAAFGDDVSCEVVRAGKLIP